jgi:hypothetical protein
MFCVKNYLKEIMRIFTKRNQIIFLNSICLGLYTYGLYVNYNEHGSISYVYSTDEGNDTRPMSIIINGIFILCLLSTLYQLLDRFIFFKNPNRFQFAQLGLKIASCAFGFFVLLLDLYSLKL